MKTLILLTTLISFGCKERTNKTSNISSKKITISTKEELNLAPDVQILHMEASALDNITCNKSKSAESDTIPIRLDAIKAHIGPFNKKEDIKLGCRSLAVFSKQNWYVTFLINRNIVDNDIVSLGLANKFLSIFPRKKLSRSASSTTSPSTVKSREPHVGHPNKLRTKGVGSNAPAEAAPAPDAEPPANLGASRTTRVEIRKGTFPTADGSITVHNPLHVVLGTKKLSPEFLKGNHKEIQGVQVELKSYFTKLADDTENLGTSLVAKIESLKAEKKYKKNPETKKLLDMLSEFKSQSQAVKNKLERFKSQIPIWAEGKELSALTPAQLSVLSIETKGFIKSAGKYAMTYGKWLKVKESLKTKNPKLSEKFNKALEEGQPENAPFGGELMKIVQSSMRPKLLLDQVAKTMKKSIPEGESIKIDVSKVAEYTQRVNTIQKRYDLNESLLQHMQVHPRGKRSKLAAKLKADSTKIKNDGIDTETTSDDMDAEILRYVGEELLRFKKKPNSDKHQEVIKSLERAKKQAVDLDLLKEKHKY